MNFESSEFWLFFVRLSGMRAGQGHRNSLLLFRQLILEIWWFFCSYLLGCLGSVRSNCNSKKWIIWFIMGSPAKFQPPNPSITASNCIPRFWSFGRFVWKSKKLPNFFIFEKFFTFLFWISWFEYLRVHHVEFSSNLFLVWKLFAFFEISSAILYGKINWSRISRNKC